MYKVIRICKNDKMETAEELEIILGLDKTLDCTSNWM